MKTKHDIKRSTQHLYQLDDFDHYQDPDFYSQYSNNRLIVLIIILLFLMGFYSYERYISIPNSENDSSNLTEVHSSPSLFESPYPYIVTVSDDPSKLFVFESFVLKKSDSFRWYEGRFTNFQNDAIDQLIITVYFEDLHGNVIDRSRDVISDIPANGSFLFHVVSQTDSAVVPVLKDIRFEY